MKIRSLAKGAAVALLCLPFAACESKFFGAEDVDVIVPSQAEAKAQADEEINADNAEDELEKLEKEIQEDEADG
jgi:hypothetical protein